jgi:hypothetical protein
MEEDIICKSVSFVKQWFTLVEKHFVLQSTFYYCAYKYRWLNIDFLEMKAFTYKKCQGILVAYFHEYVSIYIQNYILIQSVQP